MRHEGMKKKTKFEIAALAVAILGAFWVWYFNFRSASGASRALTSVKNYKPMGVENPQIYWDRLAEVQQTEYIPSPRDIFSRELPPPPPQPVHIPVPGDSDYVAPVVPPPPPPKLPLKYFGEGMVEFGSDRRAFLTNGDTVYVVAEGDIVLGRYRILKINRMNLEFEEIGSGRHGTAKLEDQGPAL
jgi:hypothetical protein